MTQGTDATPEELEGYKAYQNEEWLNCEQYSLATGNDPYGWIRWYGEELEEWVQKERNGQQHKSYWE